MTPKVYVFLAEGFEEIEAITPIDVLRRAECEVITVSITDQTNVEGAHGVMFETDTVFSAIDFSDADVLFLPGGLPGAYNLNNHEGLKKLLVEHANQGKTTSAICAAPLVLGGLGLLEGKSATCYPGHENALIGANVTGTRCVKDGNIVTGNGPGAAMALALELVTILKGAEVADALESVMMFKN